MSRSEDKGRFQMLWDCPACGNEGLLGVDHRFCPTCGAAQDPSRRYFPPDDKKVPAADHPFHGADKVCPACDTPNSAKSSFCEACGSPLDGAREAARRDDRVTGDGEAFAGESVRDAVAEAKRERQEAEAARLADLHDDPLPERRRGGGSWLAMGCVGTVAVAVIGAALFCLLSFLWSTTEAVEVVGHQWTRQVPIEAFGPVEKSGWKDEVPATAQGVTCREEKRGSRRVEDGEDCRTRRKDNGDGTFNEVRECTPRYRDEPTYDQKCRYTVDAWRVVRTEQTAGSDLSPRWPEVRLNAGEREGERGGTYTVHLQDPKGARHSCALDEPTWASYQPGAKVEARFGGLTGLIDCASLRR